MNKLLLMCSILSCTSPNLDAQQSIYNITINSITGDEIKFRDFEGKKILIVNVASNCGFTKQYEGLENLYQKYKDKLVIVGVPCNQFGGQEPGSNQDIIEFCQEQYGVSFLITEKIDVSGKNQHSLYEWLCNKDKNGISSSTVKWNFQKYIIDEQGKLLNYFYSITKPNSNKIISLIR